LTGRGQRGVTPAEDNHDGHEEHRQNYPREDTRHEEPADGLLGQYPVHDKDGAGRNQYAQAAGGGDAAGGQGIIVAVPLHLRQRHLAHGGGGGVGRAADSGKAGAPDDGGHSQAATHPAEDIIAGIVEAAAHPGGKSNGAHEDKHRDNGQGIGRQVGEYIAGQDAEPGIRRCQYAETD